MVRQNWFVLFVLAFSFVSSMYLFASISLTDLFLGLFNYPSAGFCPSATYFMPHFQKPLVCGKRTRYAAATKTVGRGRRFWAMAKKFGAKMRWSGEAF